MGWLIILIVAAAVIGCCVMWVTGIHHMNKHFPNYKAEDFLNDKEDDE
jgi:hypothetical protein